MFELEFFQNPRKMAVVATLVALGFYLCLLPERITGDDAGELTAAAYFLGIPHPPGYPTWCLAAHPFTWVPIGSVAWRVALSSAVFSALTCGLTAWLVARLTKAAWAGLIAALVYAMAVPTVEQSIVAEVYALSHLTAVACLCLLYRWQAERRDGLLWAVALLCGLGQGVHNTMTVLTPIFAGYVLLTAPEVLRRPRLVAICAGCFALGLSTFLYLPLRSLANPPIDWGNPETWENFWAVVGRDQYAFMYSQYPRSMAGYLGQLREIFYTNSGAWSIAMFIPLLGFFGLILRLSRPFTFSALLLACSLVPLLVITWLQNPRMATGEWQAVMQQFYPPMVWAIAVGVGMWLGKSARYGRLILCTLCLLGITLPGYLALLRQDLFPTQDEWVDSYARNQLEQMEPHAILFAGADHLAFPVLYLQSVEGVRRDVTLGNPYGYVDIGLLHDAPSELRERLGKQPRRGLDPEYFAWLLQHTDRPVYFSDRPKLPEGTLVVFRQEGLLYRALRSDHAEAGDLLPRWPEGYRWPVKHERAIDDSFALGYSPTSIVAEFQTKRAQYFFATGDEMEAEVRANIAEGALMNDTAQINNLAVVLARYGRYERAITLFESALRLDPDNPTVLRNLERARLKMGGSN